MLGRAGLPLLYRPLSPGFDVRQFVANKGTDFQDRWHVTLFGTVIPGMLEYSRPIHSLNGEGALTQVGGIAGVTRTRYHLISYSGRHLNPLWDVIADYVRTGARPPPQP